MTRKNLILLLFSLLTLNSCNKHEGCLLYTSLARGERNTDECQNERTDRIGVTGVLFDLNDVDRVGTLASLLFEELVQFHYIHCFYQLVSAPQFIDIQINECVQITVCLLYTSRCV